MDRNLLRIKKDTETEIDHVICRREALIADGWLLGSEITISGDEFRIWTSKTKLADKLAKMNGWRIKRYDGEREVYVPGDVDYSVLKAFGAKVKRVMTGEALEAARHRAARLNATLKKHVKAGVVDASRPQKAS